MKRVIPRIFRNKKIVVILSCTVVLSVFVGTFFIFKQSDNTEAASTEESSNGSTPPTGTEVDERDFEHDEYYGEPVEVWSSEGEGAEVASEDTQGYEEGYYSESYSVNDYTTGGDSSSGDGDVDSSSGTSPPSSESSPPDETGPPGEAAETPPDETEPPDEGTEEPPSETEPPGEGTEEPPGETEPPEGPVINPQ